MPEPEYIYVYGTLLKGEPNNSLLKNCVLEDYISIPGTLYDTGAGYPAALPEGGNGSGIFGELYRLPADNNLLLKTLDRYEDTSDGIFKRNTVNIDDKKIFIYSIKDPLVFDGSQTIFSGSWLQYSPGIKDNPLSFVTNFENSHKFYYRFLSHEREVVLPGDSGIIISAPHATNHIRLNRFKVYEKYTAAISALLHSLTGASSIYTNSVSISDPNYYDSCHFKSRIKEMCSDTPHHFLLDVHGTGEDREFDVYPGIGKNREFLLGYTEILNDFYNIAEKYNISCGSLDKFPAAKQQTIAKYGAINLKIPSMQIEINKRCRNPERDPAKFLNIIGFIWEFLEKIKKGMNKS